MTCHEKKYGIWHDSIYLLRTLQKQVWWGVQCHILAVERKVGNDYHYGIDGGRSLSVLLRAAQSEWKELSFHSLYGDADR